MEIKKKILVQVDDIVKNVTVLILILLTLCGKSLPED